MSVRVVQFSSFLTLLLWFFSGACVLISALPCFIIIPYRYPVYFLDISFPLTGATLLALSSDSGYGFDRLCACPSIYLCPDLILEF